MTHTKKHELSSSTMARVDSCAWIFMADKPEKISETAQAKKCSEFDAARVYTIGALKLAKKRGTAKTYSEALDALEAVQVGDRGDPLTRTISADKTAKFVADYQRKNENAPMRTAVLDVLRMAWAHADNQNYGAYVPVGQWREDVEQPKEEKCSHEKNVCRVLGTFYTQWEEREAELNPEHKFFDATAEVIAENLRRYMAEYTARLSATVSGRLKKLVAYIHDEAEANDESVPRVIRRLLSVDGRTNEETKKLAKFAVNLWSSFERKARVTVTEFITLVYRYAPRKYFA